MKYDPVIYKRFERNPIGCFEAHMTDSGWRETKYVNESDNHLFSSELSEFIRLVHHFFKENDDWMKLQKFSNKYGTSIPNNGFDKIIAVNYIGESMDYTVHITGTTLNIFPYRKYSH